MIYQTFESKRPKPAWQRTFMPPQAVKQTQVGFPSIGETRPNQQDRSRADQFKITPDEFVRRDKIVRQMWVDCSFHVGEMVRPVEDEDYVKYGKLHIRGIFKSYHDFPTAEAMQWPETDKPFILTVAPDRGEEKLLLITPDYICRFYQHGKGA